MSDNSRLERLTALLAEAQARVDASQGTTSEFGPCTLCCTHNMDWVRAVLDAGPALLEIVRAADRLAADVKMYGGLHISREEAERADADRSCSACDELVDIYGHREGCALVAYDAARARLP